jgi:hypothetical protein
VDSGWPEGQSKAGRVVQPGGGLVADEARNPQPAARRVLGRAEGGADLLRLPGHELIDGIRQDEALTLWR